MKLQISFIAMIWATLILAGCDADPVTVTTIDSIHGMVLDQNGDPISGVHVAARYAKVEAITNTNGEYSLPKTSSFDSPDTLDITDQKTIRAALPISWRVKRFEDAILIRRKISGSLSGDTSGSLKAEIRVKSGNGIDGMPAVVNVSSGKFQGEITTLHTEETLDVQVMLLDTASRIIGKSLLLHIQPRSGNILIPVFQKLNTFQNPQPTIDCTEIGSWDTCSISIQMDQDTTIKMWFREFPAEPWSNFHKTFKLPPRLRMADTLSSIHAPVSVEIRRQDSSNIERIDTIHIPWRPNPPKPKIRNSSRSYEIPLGQDFQADITTATHSNLAKIKSSTIHFGTYKFIHHSGCDKVACSLDWDERIQMPLGAIPNIQQGTQSIRFPITITGNWYLVLESTADNGESATSDTLFLHTQPSSPTNTISAIDWEAEDLIIKFEKAFDNNLVDVHFQTSYSDGTTIYSPTYRTKYQGFWEANDRSIRISKIDTLSRVDYSDLTLLYTYRLSNGEYERIPSNYSIMLPKRPAALASEDNLKTD